MAASAAFTINGGSSPQSVSSSSTVTLALRSTTGVTSVAWSIIGWSDSTKTPPAITPGGSPPGATATFTMNGSIGSVGFTLLIMCRINGGVDSQGQPVTGYTATGVVGVQNANGKLPFALGEKFERNSITGIADDLNALLATAAGGGTGNVVGAVSSTDKGIARFNGTNGKTIQNTSGPKLEDDGRISAVTDPAGAQDVVTQNFLNTRMRVASASTAVAFGASPYTLASTVEILEVDTTGGVVVVNLPNPNTKRMFFLDDIKGNFGVNKCTLHRFGSEKIAGVAADRDLTATGGTWWIRSNGTDWRISGII